MFTDLKKIRDIFNTLRSVGMEYIYIKSHRLYKTSVSLAGKRKLF